MSFAIPGKVLEETETALRADAVERTVVWQLAEPPDPANTVTTVVVPEQHPVATPFGHLVRVPGSELARMQFEAYHAGRRTWIQLHTHPGTDVRMSPTDRKWAIADFPGSLSIIVPVFGRRGLREWPGVAVYERGEVKWRRWSRAEVLAGLAAP
jgi:hypothetical protein